ncbi:hypothetical protein HYH03_011743 [Edaphochlamys debaryana]|uniref:Uncharacterized protein n=1 Tax=Edaphochlamys debaryana TaxID=47281 RepID=A0A835XU48_9CHLO|nr:hypothetical protein HYH03_011743 [Edaphochlamys debaryana]|eukprot:KAG2489794.1 hypothetical protein HYH03_011743 [Edaphochlamys debaryana]
MAGTLPSAAAAIATAPGGICSQRAGAPRLAATAGRATPGPSPAWARAPRPTDRRRGVAARMFRDGDAGVDSSAPASSFAATPPSPEVPPSQPLGNAVPFVPSTRRRHSAQPRIASVAAGAAARDEDRQERLAAAAEAGEAMRGVEARYREAQLQEDGERAASLDPALLIGELTASATVPFGDPGEGSLDRAGLGQGSGEGEALGAPSAGAGPYGGLAVEIDVDLDAGSGFGGGYVSRYGGYTVVRPGGDPAYDDIGRELRKEQGTAPRGGFTASAQLAAEAAARKAATAEDLREGVLDSNPELQDVYGVFGPSSLAADDEGGDNARLEAMLEAAPFGLDGEAGGGSGSALSDPLRGGGGAGAAGDPLSALDALAHQAALERLQGMAPPRRRRAGLAPGRLADPADVMPTPPPRAAAKPAAGPAKPAAAAAAAKAVGRGGRRRATATPGDHALAGSAAASAAPVYGNSPDVADEDLAAPPPLARAAGVAAKRRGGNAAAAKAGPKPLARKPHVYGTPGVYSNSPDVLDTDVDGGAKAAAAADSRDDELPPPAPLSPVRPPAPRPPPMPRGPSVASAAAAVAVATGRAAPGSHSPTSPASTPTSSPPSPTAAASPSAPAAVPAPAPTPAAPAANTAFSVAVSIPPPTGTAAVPDSRKLKSLLDVDRQFLDADHGSGWDETAHDLRKAMRSTSPKPKYVSLAQQQLAKGFNSQATQTIGIHGGGGGGGNGSAAAKAPDGGAASGAAAAASTGVGGMAGAGGSQGDVPRSVLRVEYVPSQTYGGVTRTAAVLQADGTLTLLARPTGPSKQRVKAALQLLRMSPESGEFRASARAAEAAADVREAAAAAAAAVSVAEVVAAAGERGLEMEVIDRRTSPVSTPEASATMNSTDERDLMVQQPGLILGVTEINPDEVVADPGEYPFQPLGDHWSEPLGMEPMSLGSNPGGLEGEEGRMASMEYNEDLDEVMSQLSDGRCGWGEDGTSMFESDVY